MKSIRVALIVGAVIMLNAIAGAHAEDLPQTIVNSQLSVTRGFEQSSVPVLHRAPTTDAATVAKLLTAKLCTGACTVTTTNGDGNTVNLNGNDWSLTISTDGSSAEFQDRGVQAKAHSLGIDPSQKMSAMALEQAGRKFIAAKLDSVITLSADEELYPVRTAYRREWGQDLGTGESHNAVVANRIVFGRKLRGVPVVGGGSTVVITFTNDGAIESFRYDWPRYTVETEQSVVDADVLLQRVQKAVSSRTGIAAAQPIKRPANDGSTYPVTLAPNTELQVLECGYFDPGLNARDAKAPVQPGCSYHVVVQNDGSRQGYAGAVPAGMQFQLDSSWRESQPLSQQTGVTN